MNRKYLSLVFFTQIFFSYLSISQISQAYFFSARFYDPKFGRFTAVDTVTPRDDSQGRNPYAYTFNNPLKYTDPDGHIPQDPTEKEVKTNKIVKTAVLVRGTREIPDAGPRVAEALQILVGKRATIHATALKKKKRTWRIDYEPNPNNNPKSKGTFSRSWRSLKKSLDASQDLRRSGGYFQIKLATPESRMGHAINNAGIDLGSTGALGITRESIIDQGRRRLIEIGVIANPDERYYEAYLGQLAITLGHELKHARDFVENKLGNHSNSPLPYIFYDDPTFAEELLYANAFNKSRSLLGRLLMPYSYDISNPESNSDPMLSYPAGLVVRKTFESMGIYPTKMKPREPDKGEKEK